METSQSADYYHEDRSKKTCCGALSQQIIVSLCSQFAAKRKVMWKR